MMESRNAQMENKFLCLYASLLNPKGLTSLFVWSERVVGLSIGGQYGKL